MMFKVSAILLLVALVHYAQSQIKTAGIKTHYPAEGSNSSQLVLNRTSQEQHYYNAYGYNQYVPVQVYDNNSNHYESNLAYMVNNHRPHARPDVMDATAEFINKTRSGMASGVCHKEVPTKSLVRGPHGIPVGNGTTPDMSKIKVCCEGYQRNAHVLARCDPICVDDCPNGICTAPNTCVCIPGHVLNPHGKCIATCPIGCENGVCNEQGKCQCKPGFKLEPKEGKFCVAHCDPPCQFGKCVEPNKCACEVGYRLTAIGVCEPKCDNCDNGRCTAPGFCTCLQGYQKLGENCEPVCSKGCPNGRCVGPERCECEHGFELDQARINCVPHCDLPCLNGVCSGGNKCKCNEGYKPDEYQKNLCQPHCSQGCENGYCSAPERCLCKAGFRKSGVKGRQTCMQA